MCKKIFFYSFLLFLNISNKNTYALDVNVKKPKINQNTQIITKFGCERPKQWGKIEKEITISNTKQQGLTLGNTNLHMNTIKCIFTTRHWVLFDTSIIEPDVLVKKCKHKGKDGFCCKVLKGQWKVFDGNKDIIETDTKKIQIDHILPFNYIRLNMKDCKLTSKYYNFLENLTPMYADENQKKKDILCSNEIDCWQQRKICKKMSNYFQDKQLCQDLFNISNENEDIKNK